MHNSLFLWWMDCVDVFTLFTWQGGANNFACGANLILTLIPAKIDE